MPNVSDWTISDWTVSRLQPESDPELERLLDEEEEIAARTATVRGSGYLWTDDLIDATQRTTQALRDAFRFTPLDAEGVVPQHYPGAPVPIPDETRWAAPDRNLRVGDRVRWTAVNGQDGEGTVTEVRPSLGHNQLNNIPDWVPRCSRHQVYRVTYDGDIRPPSNIAWFRIQRRLETDE